MKIAVIGYGDASTPSTRFRFLQYQALLESEGHTLHLVYKSQIETAPFWETLQSADVIVNQKCLLNSRYAKKIFALGKPVFFDFDDAIWTRPNKPYSWLTQRKVDSRLNTWLSAAAGVMVANRFLAAKASEYSQNVHVIPMALDTQVWKPRDRSAADKDWVIGWNGGPNNLPQLEALNDPLKAVLEQVPAAKLKVFCGKKPNFDFTFEHHPFDADQEVSFVQSLDIGLLPLQQDEYADGKSPIKALQYLACDVMVVGNINRGGSDFLNAETCVEVREPSDWEKRLSVLLQAPKSDGLFNPAGLEKISEHHSVRGVFELLKNQLIS